MGNIMIKKIIVFFTSTKNLAIINMLLIAIAISIQGYFNIVASKNTSKSLIEAAETENTYKNIENIINIRIQLINELAYLVSLYPGISFLDLTNKKDVDNIITNSEQLLRNINAKCLVLITISTEKNKGILLRIVNTLNAASNSIKTIIKNILSTSDKNEIKILGKSFTDLMTQKNIEIKSLLYAYIDENRKEMNNYIKEFYR